MSRRVLSKLDVDVLVQLALVGPSEAQRWDPLIDDPDSFGSLLWTRNYDRASAADDDPLPSYSFNLLPITITAAEGLKQLAYYESNTEDEENLWRRDGLGTTLDWLQVGLIHWLPDVAAAPWGWTAGDLEARRDRPDPRPEVPDVDPRAAALVERYREAGVELQGGYVPPQPPPGLSDPREVVGHWHYYPPGYLGTPPLSVLLATNEDAAHRLFLGSLPLSAAGQRLKEIERSVSRFGCEVLALEWAPTQPLPRDDRVMRVAEGFGQPDEQWKASDPPLLVGTGQVLAQDVRLTVLSGDHRCLVARTPKQIKDLAAMIADDELRDRVSAVNAMTQSVVLLRGIPYIEDVQEVVVHETVEFHRGNPKLTTSIEIHGRYLSQGIGSVLITDRLPAIPYRVSVRSDDKRNVRLPGDQPPPPDWDR